jgi:fructokinase
VILCCGEALIDMIPTPTAAGAEGFVPHSGGAVFNTAIALGRLGVEVGFLTGLSTDLFGQQLAADLAASNVETRACIRSDLPTTLAFVRLENGQASYTFYDENTAGRSIDPDHAIALPEAAETLYFGGISLISEPAADFYAALAQRESQRRTIMLDPNVRAGFIRDEARYRDRLQRMVAVSDIVKVSDEDLHWIMPGNDRSTDEKGQALLDAGVKLVVVTRGGDGASAFTAAGERIDVPAARATVVDTVGAGDTFNAGFLAGLHEQGMLGADQLAALDAEGLRRALTKAAAVAAITVSRAGANPPWAQELAAPAI